MSKLFVHIVSEFTRLVVHVHLYVLYMCTFRIISRCSNEKTRSAWPYCVLCVYILTVAWLPSMAKFIEITLTIVCYYLHILIAERSCLFKLNADIGMGRLLSKLLRILKAIKSNSEWEGFVKKQQLYIALINASELVQNIKWYQSFSRYQSPLRWLLDFNRVVVVQIHTNKKMK